MKNKPKQIYEILHMLAFHGMGNENGRDYMFGYNDAVYDIIQMITDKYNIDVDHDENSIG